MRRKFKESVKNSFLAINEALTVNSNVLKSWELFKTSQLNESELIELLCKVSLLFNVKASIDIKPEDIKQRTDIGYLFNFFISITNKLDLQNFHNFKYESQTEIMRYFEAIDLSIKTFIQNKDINVSSNKTKLEEITKIHEKLLLFKQENIIQNIITIISQEENFKKAQQLFNDNQFADNNLIQLYSILHDLFIVSLDCISSEDSLFTPSSHNNTEDFLTFFTLILKKIDLQNFYNLTFSNQVLLINIFDKFNIEIENLKSKGFYIDNEALSAFINTKQNIINLIEVPFNSKVLKDIKMCEEESKEFSEYPSLYQYYSNKMKNFCLELYNPIKLLLAIENQNRLVNLEISLIINHFIMYCNNADFWNNDKVVKNLLNYCKKQSIFYDNVTTIFLSSIKHNNSQIIVELCKTYENFIKLKKQYIFEILIINYQEEYKSIVENLINNPEIDVNSYDECENLTLLSKSIIKGSEAAMLLLHSPNIEINTYKNSKGRTPLMVAIENGNSKVIKVLLNNFPTININAQDDNGDTALMYAVINFRRQTIPQLLKFSNINIYVKNNNGDTALSLALKQNCKDIAEIISKNCSFGNHQQGIFKPDSSPSNAGSTKKRSKYS